MHFVVLAAYIGTLESKFKHYLFVENRQIQVFIDYFLRFIKTITFINMFLFMLILENFADR